ncbi:MAG: PD40 domain-containing protein [Bacteroidales bacterium]|nr:PD40 domain-containing protein [Bacteroidales bacterium]HOA09412.1 OmpA family protein [Tenuifilaceae bacterium]HOC36187.1 OmpA family protein [Tenuifilaceae bacterium]HPA67030.1 OmpA family protein [Tenuifilaceae bacterium]HPS04991.1 OmpA family protein [Tenuifilaceae bacterium]
MKKILLLLIFLLPMLLSAQSPKNLSTKNKRAVARYNEALAAYNRYNLDEAERLLKESIKIEHNFIEAYLVLTQVYSEKGEPEKAISSAEKAVSINNNFFPKTYFNLGVLNFSIGNYQKALEYFEKYLTYHETSGSMVELARNNIERCRFAIHAVANPVPFNPANIGDSINTTLDEYWPSLSVDERTIVYTVRLPKEPEVGIKGTKWQEDFYTSTRNEDGTWSKGIPVGSPLSTVFNEGAQSLSSDGKTMYYTICQGDCDLYFSTINSDGSWGHPLKLPPAINSEKSSEKQPSISPDGQMLYFVSNRPGGLGGFDIWVSVKNPNEVWGNAVNLGQPVNSPGNEQSPFIHFDNKTLYFSSNDHIGMGGQDIFVSHLTDSGKWSEPLNLGYPINTCKNEEGLVVNAIGKTAYYSSNYIPDKGMDIYTFELYPEIQPIPSSYVTGTIRDYTTLKPVEAHISLIDLQSKRETMNSYSSVTGGFMVCLPSDNSYALFAQAPGYLFYSENFNLKGLYSFDKPYHLDVLLKPVRQGEVTIMRNVFFETDSYELLPESTVELDRVVETLSQNPTIKVEIGGHTDNQGAPDYNQKLSERRAKSVVDYLLSKSVSPERVSWKGYGESQPVAPNSSPEGRAMNRRTELKILEN